LHAVRRHDPAPRVEILLNGLLSGGEAVQQVQLLEFDCEVLGAPEHDQRLVIHAAPEGSVTAQRLDLLVSRAVVAGRLPEPWTPVPVSQSSA